MSPKKLQCIKCDMPALKGFKRGTQLCQYHWNVQTYGKQWADWCENPKFIGTDENGNPRFKQ